MLNLMIKKNNKLYAKRYAKLYDKLYDKNNFYIII